MIVTARLPFGLITLSAIALSSLRACGGDVTTGSAGGSQAADASGKGADDGNSMADGQGGAALAGQGGTGALAGQGGTGALAGAGGTGGSVDSGGPDGESGGIGNGGAAGSGGTAVGGGGAGGNPASGGGGTSSTWSCDGTPTCWFDSKFHLTVVCGGKSYAESCWCADGYCYCACSVDGSQIGASECYFLFDGKPWCDVHHGCCPEAFAK